MKMLQAGGKNLLKRKFSLAYRSLAYSIAKKISGNKEAEKISNLSTTSICVRVHKSMALLPIESS